MALWKRSKDFVTKGLLAITLLHCTTQAIYWMNDAYHELKPSELRSSFKKQFGIKLNGWHADIEEEKNDMTFIGEAIVKEQQEISFELSSMRIEPANYFKNNIIDQIDRLFSTGHTGYYVPGIETIVLEPHAHRSTVHHEIKHAKTFDVLKKHPEFKTRWEELAKDEQGQSLYLNIGQQACIRVRLLEWGIDKSKHNSLENEKLGFASNYARTNFYEDVAVIGEEVETGDQDLQKQVAGQEKNKRIASKIALAQEYQIIPPEYTEFSEIDIAGRAIWVYRSIDSSKIGPYMKLTDDFLKKHPKSVYEMEIRNTRARLLYHQSHKYKPTSTLAQSEAEYIRSIQAPFKGVMEYGMALERLEELYRELKNPLAQVYTQAQEVMRQRREGGDMKLAKDGVNDFLREKKAF